MFRQMSPLRSQSQFSLTPEEREDFAIELVERGCIEDVSVTRDTELTSGRRTPCLPHPPVNPPKKVMYYSSTSQ